MLQDHLSHVCRDTLDICLNFSCGYKCLCGQIASWYVYKCQRMYAQTTTDFHAYCFQLFTAQSIILTVLTTLTLLPMSTFSLHYYSFSHIIWMNKHSYLNDKHFNGYILIHSVILLWVSTKRWNLHMCDDWGIIFTFYYIIFKLSFFIIVKMIHSLYFQAFVNFKMPHQLCMECCIHFGKYKFSMSSISDGYQNDILHLVW